MDPYHEFECTGRDDKYIQNLDITDRCRKEYESESAEEYPTLANYIEDYYGYEGVPFGDEPDLVDSHKFGYYQVDETGSVVKVVERTNPNSKWDWYVEGGRWTGFFPLKKGGDANSARKGDIDFEGARKEAADTAEARYMQVHAVIAGRPIPSWPMIRDQYADVSVAREHYYADPVLADLSNTDFWKPWDEVEAFDCDRETFIQRARDNAISAFAVVQNGVWFERGKMLMFGASVDEMSEDVWNAQVARMIESLSDDTVLTIVDCHI